MIGYLSMLNKSKAKYIVLFILFIFHNVLVFASNEWVHNNQLNQVLFGQDTVRTIEQKNIVILEKALYLAIDEFNGYNSYKLDNYLSDLKDFGVINLPSRDQIDYVTFGGEHQKISHRGWDFKKYENQQLWETRKNLLLSTLDKLFNFNENEMDKKDSFGALCYYIHIIGDHIGDEGKKPLRHRMPLNGRSQTQERSDIIWELEYHIPRLFREQANSSETENEYKELMKYLKEKADKPRFIYTEKILDEDLKKLREFAGEILNVLIKNIPALLKNERFFSRVFY
jgi:hypothetical protein